MQEAAGRTKANEANKALKAKCPFFSTKIQLINPQEASGWTPITLANKGTYYSALQGHDGQNNPSSLVRLPKHRLIKRYDFPATNDIPHDTSSDTRTDATILNFKIISTSITFVLLNIQHMLS